MPLPLQRIAETGLEECLDSEAGVDGQLLAAIDMMLTGRSVQPEEALAMGLINRLASDGATLLDEALSFAGEVHVGHSQ